MPDSRKMTGYRDMKRAEVAALVARVIDDAERTLGPATDPRLLFQLASESIWDWWREIPGITAGLAHAMLHETRGEIERRTAGGSAGTRRAPEAA
jgi:hypothetical protein